MRKVNRVALGITGFLILYGLFFASDFTIVLLLLPLPIIFIIAIGYLVWGKKPPKKTLVFASIVSLLLVSTYSIIIIFTLFLTSNMNSIMYPAELTGKDAIDEFPSWIIPYVQDVDSSYSGTLWFDSYFTFFGLNVEPRDRDFAISEWFEVDRSLLDPKDAGYPLDLGSQVDYFHNLSQYWNPEMLKYPVVYEHSSEPLVYRKIAIYDSLGTRILFYSWYD